MKTDVGKLPLPVEENLPNFIIDRSIKYRRRKIQTIRHQKRLNKIKKIRQSRLINTGIEEDIRKHSYWGDKPLEKDKNSLCLISFNTGGLQNTSSMTSLVSSTQQYDIDVIALQEHGFGLTKQNLVKELHDATNHLDQHQATVFSTSPHQSETNKKKGGTLLHISGKMTTRITPIIWSQTNKKKKKKKQKKKSRQETYKAQLTPPITSNKRKKGDKQKQEQTESKVNKEKNKDEQTNHSHIFSGKGKDKKGRWSWVTLHGRSQKKLTIVSAYRVCKNSLAGEGGGSVWMQEYNEFLKEGIQNPDPRSQVLLDLKESILTWKEAGHSVILLIDANESLYDTPNNKFKQLMEQTDMHDGLHYLHPDLPEVPTRQPGSKQIDYICVTSDLLPFLPKGGILPIHFIHPSDHRTLLWI